MSNEIRLRSLTKTFSWRLLGGGVTFATVWFFSSSVSLASTVTLVRELLVSALYYFHERLWARVRWGTRRSPENRK